MRSSTLLVLVNVCAAVCAALLATGCVTPPPPGAPSAPPVSLLGSDPGAFEYGRTGAEVLYHAELRDKVRALFGPDWAPAAQSGGKVVLGAAQLFGSSRPPRLVRIEEHNYIAVAGCAPSACGSQRGLVLIRQDGEQLLARLDEGGFSHYYGYGSGLTTASLPPSIDNAWRVLDRRAGL